MTQSIQNLLHLTTAVSTMTHLQQEVDGVNLLRLLRNYNLFNIAKLIATLLKTRFPHSVDTIEELALAAYYSADNQTSFDAFTQVLEFRGLSEEIASKFIFNSMLTSDAVLSNYVGRAQSIVDEIVRRPRRHPFVTFSITSCKRLDLFRRTMNSFLHCCLDHHLIDQWICIDDNSSDSDRKAMESEFPFFVFVFKSETDKGHARSMNIIQELVRSPFLFHMEDDWQFFIKRNYISDCLDVLGQDARIGQCLINKNYAETKDDVRIKGGRFHVTNTGLRYYVHEYVKNENDLKLWIQKHGDGVPHCNYWPHFSFRPSLLRTKIFKEIGRFNSAAAHFEMEYAHRYDAIAYRSAFLEGIYCKHIGRLTSERLDPTKSNAYSLNDESQFTSKSTTSETRVLTAAEINGFVVNMSSRPDRMTKFKKEAAKARFQRYERWPAVVGAELQPSIQLQRLFDNNDYDMRCGIVGCALSHIGLYIKLLNDPYANYYLILEDDATFVPNFVDKLDSVCGILSRSEYRHWDLVYLGHHPRFIGVGDGLNHSDEIRLEKKMASEALGYSLGGTAGYLIAKSGALKLLKFIDRRGMSNAIDTIQQLAADELHVYYAVPLLVPSECVRTPEDVTKVDSDIQFCSKSLTLPFEVVIEKELEFYAAREMKLVKVAIDDSFPTEEDWYIVVDAEDLLSSQDRLAEIFNRASRKDDKHVYFLQDPYFPPFVRNRALFCVDLSRSTFKSRLCPDTDGVYSIAF